MSDILPLGQLREFGIGSIFSGVISRKSDWQPEFVIMFTTYINTVSTCAIVVSHEPGDIVTCLFQCGQVFKIKSDELLHNSREII